MSSSNSPSAADRAELLLAMKQALRENSSLAVMLHTVIGERMGLSAVEEKTLAVLQARGSLTAGEIAEHTGLAPASVTSLIDRLEKKGFARRVRDTNDRRRVMVELNEDQLNSFAHLFNGLAVQTDEFLASYTNEQLALILDFVERATSWSREYLATLTSADQPPRSSNES
jgi:DNA-binding MarR family transcriptional regulator